tara:strand:- start:2671 stop:3666 length:996 start_codon:yes stop_codon:yes gene_type:complete
MFRDIDRKNVSIKRFETNKTFTLTHNDSGSGLFAVRAVSKSLYNYDSGSDIITTITSGSITTNYYALPTWHTINKMYYKDASNPIGVFGNSNTTSTKRELHTSASVFSIPKDLFGERIKPGTFELSDTSRGTTFDIRDDGDGNLYDFAFSSSFSAYKSSSFTLGQGVLSNNSGSQVGNIFYEHGIAVINNTGSYGDVGFGTGYDIKYKATHRHYEYLYEVMIPANNFNTSMNVSITKGYSGSITLDSKTQRPDLFFPPGDNPSGEGTGSFNTFYNATDTQLSFVTSSDFYPYVSTIGLYDDKDNLLVVGKLAHPIKLSDELDTTFVIRFDV